MLQFHKMDTLRACITNTKIYLYMPGQEPKICDKDTNQVQVEMMMNEPSITQQEFEENIPTDSSVYCFFKTCYLAAVEAIKEARKEPA